MVSSIAAMLLSEILELPRRDWVLYSFILAVCVWCTEYLRLYRNDIEYGYELALSCKINNWQIALLRCAALYAAVRYMGTWEMIGAVRDGGWGLKRWKRPLEKSKRKQPYELCLAVHFRCCQILSDLYCTECECTVQYSYGVACTPRL